MAVGDVVTGARDEASPYRDTALKILVVAVSGLMGYVATTWQASPRWDYVTVAWLAIIAIDLAAMGVIDSRAHAAERRRCEEARHAEVLSRLDAQDERLRLLLDAQQQTMRATLIRDAERYCERGWVTPEEHRAYSEGYGSYERLGLNGYIRTYLKRVDALPVKELDSVICEGTD